MILIIRLIPNSRCCGCSCVGYTDEKTLLCLYCLSLKINVETRKRKLTSTLAGRFAFLKEKIRNQLREFGRAR